MEYEYNVLQKSASYNRFGWEDYGGCDPKESFMKQLSKMISEGWELVGSIQYSTINGSRYYSNIGRNIDNTTCTYTATLRKSKQ
jgi:hypothetical protein